MVTRFIIVDEDKDDIYLRTHPEGPLVRYADYRAVQQTCEQVRKDNRAQYSALHCDARYPDSCKECKDCLQAQIATLQQAHDRLTGVAQAAATALMEIRYQAGLGYVSDTKFRVHTLATDALKILTEAGIHGGAT